MNKTSMDFRQDSRAERTRERSLRTLNESTAAHICLQLVDACLIGTIFVAPIFLGGRGPIGRFTFIAIACLGCVAWCVHQALLKQAYWTRTWANVIGVSAILLVVLQLTPLPPAVINLISPRTSSLLPLWSPDSNESLQLGVWSTLTLTPSSTKVALATLIAYVLLFITTIQRVQSLADIEKLLRLIAISAIIMAGFGLIQYFASNGRFFWFYEHPFTTTDRAAKGTFTCRNHFAHFLALGTGPLIAWIVLRFQEQKHQSSGKKPLLNPFDIFLYVGLILIVIAVLLSLSRGGAISLTTVILLSLGIYLLRGLVSGAFLYSFAGLAILIVGLLSVYGYEQVSGRLDTLVSGSMKRLDNNRGRRKIWTANLNATQQGGLFGAGAGSHKEVYPVYLPESLALEYTHAENGPLQISTECGYLGVSLLAFSLSAVGRWCWQSVRHSASVRQLVAAVAVSSGLAASVVHSIVDFVWFIPACMSLTILLASCALRLAQLSISNHNSRKIYVSWPRLSWVGMTAIASLASIWATLITIGPARASTHWTSYLATSKDQEAERELILRTSRDVSEEQKDPTIIPQMHIFNLKQVLANHPDSARANMRLAGKYLQLFDARRQSAENSMSIDQIRDAAVSARFGSAQELQQWLLRAFGDDSKLLYQAYFHTRKALQLSPLQGQGYLYLANLCFLSGQSQEQVDSYINQSLLIRPYDSHVLFEVGRQRLLLGQLDLALGYWQQIFLVQGTHQHQIVRMLASQVPALAFFDTFQPDWRTLTYIWRRYQEVGSDEDLDTVLRFAKEFAEDECPGFSPDRAAPIWRSLARMQQDRKQPKLALESYEHAFEIAPSDYEVRRRYGQALLRAKRYSFAEPHLRWCLSRMPNDQSLRNELVEASQGGLAQAARDKVGAH